MTYRNMLTKPVPQTRPAKKEQVKNSAGGFVFKLDPWKVLDRFLIIGSERPTYYAKAEDLLEMNLSTVELCIKEDPGRVASAIAEISISGRSYRNTTCELVLVKMLRDKEARKYAIDVLGDVLSTGRQLLRGLNLYQAIGGKWNASLRRGISNWYNSKTPEALGYQVIKYQRDWKMTHRDVLRMAHPPTSNRHDHSALFKYLTLKDVSMESLPDIVQAWVAMKNSTSIKEVVNIITDNRLTWEFVPGDWQGKPEVWEAMLPFLPYGALVRNLGRMSSYGLDRFGSDTHRMIVDRLSNYEGIRRARVHPLALALAQRVYQNGDGIKGSLTWKPDGVIAETLEDAFYASFGTLEPTGKRIFLALDVSGSMGMRSQILGHFTCSELTAMMAMVLKRTEKMSIIKGFAGRFVDLSITRNTSLRDATRETVKQTFGTTDCSLPMLTAAKQKVEVDQFVVMTDNETYSGAVHPFRALEQYREQTGIPAKLVVVGMTSTAFSIADPHDDGCLDVVGFDVQTPRLILDFAK